MRELDALIAGSSARKDPIEEQLRQCPEAFKAGELIGKLFDRVKYADDESSSEHLLPAAGVVVPPLV